MITRQPNSPKSLSGCLTQNEAQKWLAQNKPNRIGKKGANQFLQYLTYFWGPLPWMIEGALVLTGIFRLWLYFFIILFLLVANALITSWLVFRNTQNLKKSKPNKN
jgi:magnesium-transporting ATPase (P-type)